jgi:uroporphyrin-III C-methyltransferase/precorrin-2 dehydrogenase/sirohydrochlorin ferrochelatase
VRLPVFLDLSGRRVLVVGGGRVATRRVRTLLDAGAEVVVVAPVLAEEITALPVTTHRRGFAGADVRGAWLVLACTDDAAVNAAAADAAEARGVWCIRADDAVRSSGWLSATATVDHVTVAVSAEGDPRRAQAIRDQLELELVSGDIAARRRRPTPGSVTLVGGGPGDPELLTVAGLRAVRGADVVVTDRLGPTDLLRSLPDGIDVVDVGKDPHGHAASQDDINTLLVQRARAGDRVVRLKGGDPFVLGRGTEELDACVAGGVPVVVIPGVTSATSAATLAGIPLTERGTTQQFTVVSGHVPPGDGRSTVDWAGLAAGHATLVLLMAVGNLAAITAALVTGGRSPDTPTAVVENASLPEQRVVRARLDDIAGVARAAGIGPPAVVVVGDVVRL